MPESKAAAIRRKRYLRETAKVKAVYCAVFKRRWPKGYRVQWDVLGLTSHKYKLLVLAFGGLREDPSTVIHELVHLAHPKLRHGKAFERLVRQYYFKAKKEFKWPNLCPPKSSRKS